MLANRKIIVGVCGSIAAYKAVFLVRLLIKAGAEVRVVMTPDAKSFVGSITFSTLTQHPVISDISTEEGWNNHVDLGLWADALVIAPATANTLAKMAQGLCDNMLLATYLSARCPVWIAPAMDLDMWAHPCTQRNVATLQLDGIHLIDVEDGELASGLQGKGRLAEPQQIVEEIQQWSARQQDLTGKHLVVTAGPTYEDLDPVRYIGNRSSGKMGIAIAVAAAERGAQVTLVLGPTHQPIPQHSLIEVVHVRSAADMAQASQAAWPTADAGILAAAVADYRPATQSDQKIKKKDGDMHVALERTIDIAKSLHRARRAGQILIGFALETQDLLSSARAKMERKGFDMIVANSPKDAGSAFGHDTNKVTLVWTDRPPRECPLMPKTEVADLIVEEWKSLLDK